MSWQMNISLCSTDLALSFRNDNGFPFPLSHVLCSTLSKYFIFSFRLDLKKKELSQRKEALLKESKVKAATMDSVKSQLDILMKARGSVHANAIISFLFTKPASFHQAAGEIQKKVDELVLPAADVTPG